MLLEVDEVCKTFHGRVGDVTALDHVSMSMQRGECFGVIGESGSGKTTLAQVVAGILPPDAGTVRLGGVLLDPRARASRRRHMRSLQVIFQDSRAAFDPRMSVGESLREPLVYKRRLSRREQDAAVARALDDVGLPAAFVDRGIHSISVGQAQRVGIARALLAEPELIICDEITSALDVTVQASVLSLLADLQAASDLSVLFISHDIAVVAEIADRIAVMEGGKVVESGEVDAVVNHPQHPFTRALIEVA